MNLLAEYLPRREAADIIAQRVRLSLGGKAYTLPALTIDATEAWQDEFGTGLAVILQGLGELASPAAALGRLAAATDFMLALLEGYDGQHLLPSRTEIKATASPDQLLRATLEVLAAAYPTLAIVLDAIASNAGLITDLLAEGLRVGQARQVRQTTIDQLPEANTASGQRTNGAQPPTGGRRVKSGAR